MFKLIPHKVETYYKCLPKYKLDFRSKNIIEGVMEAKAATSTKFSQWTPTDYSVC